jgi:hypothetical protein
MKNTMIVALFLVLLAGALPLAAQSQSDARFSSDIAQVLSSVPTSSVSGAEIDGLLLMREEEKLARDVYLTLAEKWGIRTFSNIAESEQTHMDAMELILDRYGIADPIKDDAVGVFTSPVLDKLYDDLVAKGSSSAAEAVKVGATIEELDIADLVRLIAATDNDDIKIVYQNLLKGSRNHLRAFDRQIGRYGVSYEPQYISRAEYDRILDSRQESGGPITDPQYRF